MIKNRKAPRRPGRLEELRNRLRAAEDTLRALRAGDVDALVVTRAGDERVVPLQGADLPYRILFDQMNEGAVTVMRDGVIAYCNRRFADIVGTPLARVIGAPLRRFVPPADQAALEGLLQGGSRENARGDLSFRVADGSPVPVAVSFAPLRAENSADVIGVVGVIRDITERKQLGDLRNRLIEQVITAQDEERRRIARELHDETGQSLTALLVGLRTIEGSKTVGQAVELAQRLRETTAQTLLDVGRLWRGLHPGVLDDVGLAAAVTGLAEEFARLHGIAVDVRTEGLDADGLSPLLSATAYRVVQEALTNVARHAGARTVRVRLLREEATVELRVQDDGTGFEPGHGGRLGLRGMRERAALLGGSLVVESHLGAGTIVTAHLPVRGA
ncbi:MAG TPA: PAS domain S-box protein [Gemmatimonadales bacterium]